MGCIWVSSKMQIFTLSETWPQKAELNIMPMKTIVVSKACLYWLTPHSQCNAGDKMLKIMTSMESAIQQRPVTKLKMIWNLPNPNELTACVTVNESSGTTPEAAAVIWISAPMMSSKGSCSWNPRKIIWNSISENGSIISQIFPVPFLVLHYCEPIYKRCKNPWQWLTPFYVHVTKEIFQFLPLPHIYLADSRPTRLWEPNQCETIIYTELSRSSWISTFWLHQCQNIHSWNGKSTSEKRKCLSLLARYITFNFECHVSHPLWRHHIYLPSCHWVCCCSIKSSSSQIADTAAALFLLTVSDKNYATLFHYRMFTHLLELLYYAEHLLQLSKMCTKLVIDTFCMPKWISNLEVTGITGWFWVTCCTLEYGI